VECCETSKYTFSATLVGFVGAGWQKSGLNRKRRNPWFLHYWTPTKNNFHFVDHHCKGKVLTDISYGESVFPTRLVSALLLFKWTQLVILSYEKNVFFPETTLQ